jgi:aquaporin Z
MSMNPARTFASAVPAQVWTGLWLYFAAPLLGMMVAGKVYLLSFGRVYCAKLHHDNDKRCIFHHGYEQSRSLAPAGACGRFGNQTGEPII